MLRWLALGTAASAGTGVLLSVPPLSFFIYPIYPQVYVMHGWFSLAMAAPFVIGVLAHGVPAGRARGRSPMTRSGVLLSVAFLGSLASAVYSARAEDPAPWLLFVHMGAGIVALAVRRFCTRHAFGRRSGTGKRPTARPAAGPTPREGRLNGCR